MKIKPSLIIRPVLFILGVAFFFACYNLFLVDRNIEMLEFSLSNAALADTHEAVSYLGPLMQAQFIDTLSSKEVDVEELMQLQYSADIMDTSFSQRKIADVTAVMGDIISEKQSRRNILLRVFDRINSIVIKFFRKIMKKEVSVGEKSIDPALLDEIYRLENEGKFDEAANLYKETITKYRYYKQAPSLMLRLGYLFHKMGRFKDAEVLYRDVISNFTEMPEAVAARELLNMIQKRSFLSKKADKIIQDISATADRSILQQLYYELGLIQLNSLDLKEAADNFKQAVSVLPDTNIAAQAYLRLGICERLMGNLETSEMTFKKLDDIASDAVLKIQSKYQTAQIYRQRGEYEKSTSMLKEAIEENRSSSAASFLLFQKGSAELFDLNKESETKKTFEELSRETSLEGMDYAGRNFVDTYTEAGGLKLFEISKLEKLFPEDVRKRIKDTTRQFANYLAGKAEEIIKERFADMPLKDNAAYYTTLDFTEAELNKRLQEWFPPGNEGNIWNVRVEFLGNQEMEISATVCMSRKPTEEKPFLMEGFIKGRMDIIPAGITYEGYEAIGEKGKVIVFIPEETKLGIIYIPHFIMRMVLRPLVEYTNKFFPLEIEEFRFDTNIVSVSGTVKQSFIEMSR